MSEPQHCVDSDNEDEDILNTTRNKVYTSVIDAKFSKLTSKQKSDLQSIFVKHKIIFGGSIGDWDTYPVSLELKPGVTLHHGKPYPVAVNSKNKFKQELQCLISCWKN